ncbi:MAG: hypothetical protein WCI27_08630, partial [Candidatus Omnitrophota bacterium]
MMDTRELRAYIRARFPGFGVNKQQEIMRLVFEIAKREVLDPADVLNAVLPECRGYAALKEHLVTRRFPLTALTRRVSESFGAVDIDATAAMPLSRKEKVPFPKRVYVEDGTGDTAVVARARARFTAAEFIPIPSYKAYAAKHPGTMASYNRRAEEIFIVQGQYGSVRHCPCSPGVVPCGYHNIDMGVGCPFECSYCFLQSYANAPGIVIPASLDGAFTAFRQFGKDIRAGSG